MNRDAGQISPMRRNGRAAAKTRRGPVNLLQGTNLKHAHAFNQRVVLETVRLRGPLSRAEISGHTSLASQTVSNIVDLFLDSGVLKTVGRRSGLRGQPAIEININPGGGHAIGVHLDRDHLTVVLLDLAGTCLQVVQREWDFLSPNEALPLMTDMVRATVGSQGLHVEDLWGVGVGLPGPLDMQAGSLVNPPNFPGWDGFPLRDLLAERLGLPVYLETDATAAAVGERWFGQGRDVPDYFYVFFGIGLGGGMILGGQPYRGAFDNAGIFGHLPVDPNGGRCPCGGVGCLELSTSLSSLYATLAAQGRQVHGISELEALLEMRDDVLMGWLENAAAHLTPALVTVEHLLSPEAILFGAASRPRSGAG